MRVLASFASSESGKAFARVERYWGRDPAAFLEDGDDVLAHNLRVALMMTLSEDEVPEEVADPGEAARIGGEKVRQAMNG